MPIATHFDVSLIATMSRCEKQIQQHYRPIIAVHKWFARRPGTLFRGLTLAEFGDRPLSESFFAANDFPGRTAIHDGDLADLSRRYPQRYLQHPSGRLAGRQLEWIIV